MTSPSPRTVRRRFRRIMTDEPRTIRAAVASEALDYDEPCQLFIDLQSCGCVCGTVGSLIYHVDTYAFFDRHYDEIEVLREEWDENHGEPIAIQGNLKNFFAWFAFEETAFRMAVDDLGLDL